MDTGIRDILRYVPCKYRWNDRGCVEFLRGSKVLEICEEIPGKKYSLATFVPDRGWVEIGSLMNMRPEEVAGLVRAYMEE